MASMEMKAKRSIVICKLGSNIELKDFTYHEKDINYDSVLNITAQHYADNNLEDEGIEVFEVKGNYIFSESGIFAAQYYDELEHVNTNNEPT